MACAELQKPNQDSIDEECWQSSLGSPGDRLSAMFNLSRLTDLTITFPDYEGSLKVHRLILAMSSPVFEVMLFGSMAEGKTLVLPEDPPEAFIFLMGYIYGGSTNLPNVPTAVQVYLLSNKYQMKALYYICSQFLLSQLNADNLSLVFDAASLLEDSLLLEKCRLVVSSLPESVFSSTYIGHLSQKSMKYLLQQNVFVKSEVDVYQGILKWGESRAGKASPASAERLRVRQEVEELLPFVRFLAMTVDEFVEHVMPSQILTLDESSAILMNIKQVGTTPVPRVFSQIRERRINYDVHNLRIVALGRGFNIYSRNASFQTDWAFEIDSEDYVNNEKRIAGAGSHGIIWAKSMAELNKGIKQRSTRIIQPCGPYRGRGPSCVNARGTSRHYNADGLLFLVSDLKFTKDIYLGHIRYTTYQNKTNVENTTLVITDSTRTVLSEVKPQISHGRRGLSRINATFQDPLLLTSTETYTMSLR